MKTIKNIKTAILSIAIGVLSSTAVYAQDHEHNSAPHGGIIEEAGGFHIESAIKSNKVYFYLLDGNAKAISNKGVTGSVLLQYADGTTKTVQLTASGKDGFSVEDTKAVNYINAVVTFKTNGKTASTKFKNKAK